MVNVIRRIFGGPGSKDDAKARLKLLLVHDAVDLTPAEMEAMKAEVVEVMSKYINLDRDQVDFRLERNEGEIALVSNVPVRRVTARAG
ncbi:MAG: cell division topological specificity factor MinE [Myxococcota bacterium]|nr:cell division topological specificity factor MinE [Myxococcota bacterium]